MKIYRVLLFLFVGLTLLFVSTQALASPADVPNMKDPPAVTRTPKPQKNPGKVPKSGNHKATQKVNKPDKSKDKKHENFKGTVTGVDLSGITLTLRDGSSVTIGLTADTRIKFPGPKGSAPTGIQNGMTVNVQAIRDQNDKFVALRVMVIPGKPSKIHRVGIVTSYTAGSSITIQDKDGNLFTFTITGDIKLLPAERADQLAVGSRVTIIAPRDPATGGFKVIGIVIHPAKP